jgi:peptide chain release factor 1
MCTVEIRPMGGGQDAANFARSLSSAICASARRGHIEPAVGDATRMVTVTLPREPAARWDWLSGLHRLQHVPGGERQRHQQRQTSWCEIAVLDDQPPARTQVRPGEVRVDRMRGRGRGGQRRNVRETAVRVVHSSGTTVTRINGRSQAENLAQATADLEERLTARAAETAAVRANETRRGQSDQTVTFAHNKFRDEVVHQATGRRWTTRAWSQGRF